MLTVAANWRFALLALLIAAAIAATRVRYARLAALGCSRMLGLAGAGLSAGSDDRAAAETTSCPAIAVTGADRVRLVARARPRRVVRDGARGARRLAGTRGPRASAPARARLSLPRARRRARDVPARSAARQRARASRRLGSVAARRAAQRKNAPHAAGAGPGTRRLAGSGIAAVAARPAAAGGLLDGLDRRVAGTLGARRPLLRVGELPLSARALSGRSPTRSSLGTTV